jgi:hypothetical protein
MNDDLTTKPTLETLLEMMRDLRDTVNERFNAVNKRFDAVDARFDAVDARFDTLSARVSELDIRIDRMDSWAHKAYSVMTALRADFNEMKVHLKEYLPSPK